MAASKNRCTELESIIVISKETMKHNWEVCRIGHFCDVKTGKLDANASCENGLYPFFTCSKEALRINSFSYNCECVLIAGNGDLNVKYYNGKFNAYQRTYIITVKPKFEDIISVEYLYNFFRLYISTLREKSVGGIIKFIKLGDITNAVINVPPIKVQKIIVSELNKINETIEDCRELLRNLDALAQSLFYDTFGDPVKNPKKWPIKQLKALSSLITNGTTPKGGQAVYVDSGITFFRSQNVWRNRLVMDDVAYLDEATNATMRGSMLHHNDILITKTGRINTENSSLGRSALFTGEDNTANINGHVYLVRLERTINPRFVLAILLTDSYRDLIRRVCVGAIDKRQLNLSHIEQFPIILPPLSLQEQFAARIEQIEVQKKAVEQTIAELQTLLDSRMDYWFN